MAVTVAPPVPAAGAPHTRAAEDRFLRDAFGTNARTFALAAWLLPRRVRLPVAVLYLYCRTIDEIADGRRGVSARDELEQARRSLVATLRGRPPAAPFLWGRLAEVCRDFGVPEGPLHELLDGAAWDIQGRAIRDRADLLAYSDLVAGSVGAMMVSLLVTDAGRRPALEAPARALGCAMQITNILRDVGEDLNELGRVYLPADALGRRGINPADLGRPGDDPAYAALCEELMSIAEGLYVEAGAGIASLDLPERAAVAAAARMYREILNEIRSARYDNITRRAVVPLHRKLRVAAGGYHARRARLLAASAPGRP